MSETVPEFGKGFFLYHVQNPDGVAFHLVEYLGGWRSTPLDSGEIMVNLPWCKILLALADDSNPASEYTISTHVRAGDVLLNWLHTMCLQHKVNADSIDFSLRLGDDRVKFHVIPSDMMAVMGGGHIFPEK